MGLVLLAGCAGSSQQVITAQILSQRKAQDLNTVQAHSQRMAQDPNKDLQQQLLMNSSRAVLANYKDYQVGPEDELSITIFGQKDLNRELQVNGQGEIDMPMVGTLKVGGMTTQQIEKRLEELYDASYLVNPQITVKVKEYRNQRVSVTGAVAKPGSYEIIGPRPLLEVLSLAGGFVNSGNPTAGGAHAGEVVNVIRSQKGPDLAKRMNTVAATQPFSPNTETMVIDLQSLVSGQDPRLNIPIRGGDVVNVPFAGIAYVLGGVRKQGNIPVTGKVTVSQAVAMAGGIDPILGTNSITIMRFDELGKRIKIDTSLSKILAGNSDDLPLKDNDVVLVKESKAKRGLFVFRALLPVPTGTYGIGAP